MTRARPWLWLWMLAALFGGGSVWLSASVEAPPLVLDTGPPEPALFPLAERVSAQLSGPLPANYQEPPTPFAWNRFPQQGLAVMAVRQGLESRLWAYHPQQLGWVRLLDQPVHAPALSPSGRWVALTLKQETGWSLALLDLSLGTWQTLNTGTPYVTAPAWSPDEQWLVYAAWDADLQRLVLHVRSAWDLTSQPLVVPGVVGNSTWPAWSPQGRLIAFVSWEETRMPQVWLVNLDRPEEPLQVSNAANGVASPPDWSPDGRYLAWCEEQEGIPQVRVWDVLEMRFLPVRLPEGCWPRWRADGQGLWLLVNRPSAWYVTQVAFPKGDLVLPLIPLPGPALGYDVGYSALPWPLPTASPVGKAAMATPTPSPVPPTELDLVEVPGVEAPYPYLHRGALPAFEELRRQARARLGWDPFTRVESLYRPGSLGHFLPDEQDWLATGFALALSWDLWRQGDLAIVREAFPTRTYWRLYLRPRAQDGSRGHPLTRPVWDLEAGRETPPPPGFWVDFTALAQALGWDRLPALPIWPTYFPASRFNILVYRNGLSWEDLERLVVPPETTPVPLEDAVP